jgi:N-methylhydantoinase B
MTARAKWGGRRGGEVARPRPDAPARGRHATPRFDAVELSLANDLFAACAEEMGVTLMRTAHSPNIKERLDHSCAIFDDTGRLVAQAAHIPVHLGSMPRAVEAARARGPFVPGDVILLNDPYAGGTHLPDLTLVSPVFLSPARRGAARAPDFFVASRAHHADVGGSAPGSLPLAREVYEEGLRIPPLHLLRAGVLQEDVLRLLLANVRTADERRADLAAQLGAQVTGARRLVSLAARHGAGARGAATLRAAAAALMDVTETRMRRALAALPRGRFRAEDLLDDDGRGTLDIRIAVTLTLGGGRARVDLTRSAPQTAGPLNAVQAVTRAAVAYVVRCIVGEMPVNDGAFRPIEVVTRPGSVVDPRPPAAVGAGNVETSQRIVDAVLRAFQRALPERVPAASSGTMNNLLVGGFDPRTGTPFVYYETLGGGHGAGPGWDGEHALQAHMTNTRNTPVEALEHAYPMRVIETRIRRGSGGKGRWRGGDGIVRAIELLAPARVTVISERRRRGPYGLAGGGEGSPGANSLSVLTARGRRVARVMPGKFEFASAAATVVTVASPGGGGFGRAPRRARRRA